jgi:hypothetical protein
MHALSAARYLRGIPTTREALRNEPAQVLRACRRIEESVADAVHQRVELGI